MGEPGENKRIFNIFYCHLLRFCAIKGNLQPQMACGFENICGHRLLRKKNNLKGGMGVGVTHFSVTEVRR
jgi:hypothetical protein